MRRRRGGRRVVGNDLHRRRSALARSPGDRRLRVRDPGGDCERQVPAGFCQGEIFTTARERIDQKAARWKKGRRAMNSAYIQERAQQRLALGKCAGCGGSPLVTKNHCARCRDLTRAAAERRRERLKSAGICLECGQAPAESGVLRCARCRALANSRSRADYNARKAAAEGKKRGGE